MTVFPSFKFNKIQFEEFREIFTNQFNPCYLVSLLILSLFSRQISALLDPNTTIISFFILLPLIDGILTAAAVYGLHMLFDRVLYSYHYQDRKQVLIVSFIAGFSTIYSAMFPLCTFVIFGIVMFVTISNIRAFVRKLGIYLEPNKIVTKEDLFNLAAFFTSLITAFIVLNLTIESLHNFFGIGQAFNFSPGVEGILDSVYFTFILMTTVGFGDIVPLTPFAKIMVSFECMTSYIMFALIIGIVNRGITKLN